MNDCDWITELLRTSFEENRSMIFRDLEEVEIDISKLMKGGSSDGCENDDEI